MNPRNKLPSSQEEVTSLIFVAMLAGLAALARLLYGREELGWRLTLGSILVAMLTAVMTYGAAVHYLGVIGGHASSAIGAGVGLFTDDALRRARFLIDRYGAGNERK